MGGCGVVSISNEIYQALEDIEDIRDLMKSTGLDKSDVQDLVQECADKLSEKAGNNANKAIDVALLKKCVHHCSLCGKTGHNRRTCGK